MGFTLTDTKLLPGHEVALCYAHHLEACYCIEGEATVKELDTGRIHNIGAGTLYALDKHDHHLLRALTEVRLICVFSPALVGDERYDTMGGSATSAS
jgi:L-ectoine synthase